MTIYIFDFLKSLAAFWQQYPALLYALMALMGINSALNWNPIILLPLAFIGISFISNTNQIARFIIAIGLFFGTFLYTTTSYLFPQLSPEGAVGTAHIEISSLSSTSTYFGKQWTYRGTMRSFRTIDGQLIAKNIPYTLSIPKNENIHHPLADRAYVVSGKLKEIAKGYYAFNATRETPWNSVEGSHSFAEWRYSIKNYVTAYIKRHIGDNRVGVFLAGIATGDFDDRLMFFEFGRFGLQHIMAISGFHFAIIATILSGFLRLVVNKKLATIFLIFLLSSYFVFLGSAPSIMRAWISILVVLGGLLIEKRGSGLNSLGVAMLIILFFDPLLCCGIGFQFSFITTAAILMFFSISDLMMQKVFAKRRLSEMIGMNLMNQHGYCTLSFFRQAIALTIAVNVIAIPMTLYYFQKFPALSLVYNLFFPFMVSIAMLLLIIGIFFSLVIPPLGTLVHAFNQTYTQFMLNFIYNIPSSLDITWRTSLISFELLISYLSVVFVLGIYFQYALKKYEENQGLTFL